MRQRFPRLLQLVHMGNIPARLDRENEPFGHSLSSVFEGLAIRQPVENIVDLHRSEMPGIVFQNIVIGKVRVIEWTLPVFIMPA